MVIGVVLAGGRGSRIGGAKPAAPLAGRALIAWPVAALAGVCERVVVVCKADTELPELPQEVERWNEPEEPRHPVAGITHALGAAAGEVLVCAGDMPFVDAPALRALLGAAGTAPGAAAVVARCEGKLQPLLAVYRPGALAPLRAAPGDSPLTRMVEGLSPVRVELPGGVGESVNTREDLARAEALLSGG